MVESGNGPSEVYFEFVAIGSAMRVCAIDAASGIEVIVVGPASAARMDLEQLALAKLRSRLKREQGPV